MASLTRLPRISTLKNTIPSVLQVCAVRLAGNDAAKPPITKSAPAPPSAPSTPNAAASDKYNAPEYYQHTTFSYYDYEIEMNKSRISQPSKYKPMPSQKK